MKSFIINLFFITTCALFLLLALRGLPGNPTASELNLTKWKENGPFELSPERGRFALTYSIIEDQSLHFSVPIARFATPDLGYKDGHFVSLFAPGISFLVLPGYLIGKYFNLAQVGTFMVIGIFAILNGLLIKGIATKLGAGTIPSIIAGLIFLFATPAFNYGVILYQHHVSTFLVLSCLYLFISFSSAWVLLPISFLIACAIPIDYPNLFLLFPIALASLGKVIEQTSTKSVTEIIICPLRSLWYIGAILPLILFLWFNQASYNNPLQLSGTVRSVQQIDVNGKPSTSVKTNPEDLERLFNTKRDDSALSFFNTRSALNGLYILLISPDRGVIVFTPIIVLGVIGLVILGRQNTKIALLTTSIAAINLTLYALWGDPWGGWAFGSRYLIPGYAMLAIGIAILLNTTTIRSRIIFIIVIAAISSYSIFVNTSGALTSSANPPKVEVLALEKLSGREEKYTYARNLDYLKSDQSKSFLFQTFFNQHLSAWSYYLIIASSLATITTVSLLLLRIGAKKS